MTYDAAELARLRESAEQRNEQPSSTVLALIDALEKALGERDEAQGLEVTEQICFDRVVRQRDALRALLRETVRKIPEWHANLHARIAKELGQ
jgi:molybdopterin converting factor small subunit